MIANAKIKPCWAERRNLMFDKLRPRVRQIRFATQVLALLLRLSRHVFIDFVDGSQVAQMPIECRLVPRNAVGCDGGHYHIAAVARVAGNNESPRTLCGRNKFDSL